MDYILIACFIVFGTFEFCFCESLHCSLHSNQVTLPNININIVINQLAQKRKHHTEQNSIQLDSTPDTQYQLQDLKPLLKYSQIDLYSSHVQDKKHWFFWQYFEKIQWIR